MNFSEYNFEFYLVVYSVIIFENRTLFTVQKNVRFYTIEVFRKIKKKCAVIGHDQLKYWRSIIGTDKVRTS